MRTKRKEMMAILVLVGVMLLQSVNVFAANQDQHVYAESNGPRRFVGIMTHYYSFKLLSNGQLSISTSINPQPGYAVGINIELQKNAGGNSWSTINTWSVEKNGYVSLVVEPYVVRGTYRLKITFTAKNSNGVIVDSDVVYSNSITY